MTFPAPLQPDTVDLTKNWDYTGDLTRNGVEVATTQDIADAIATTDLENLADVNVSAPSNGQVLSYNSGEWINSSLSGTGTVTSVSVTSQNGVSAVVTNPTTTPALAFTLEAITPSSVNASGTLTGSNFSGSSSGVNTGDQDLSGLVPKTTTVNGHALSANVTVTKSDVGLGNVANVDTTTTANITDSTNKRFVTDAELVVIDNTSGVNTGDQTISLTGDVTGSGTGTFAATLATVNSNVGSFGSATAAPTFTVDGKGRLTAAGSATITPAESAVTFTDITTNNVSTSKHGYTPKLPNDATKYLDGTGNYSVPPGTGGSGSVTDVSVTAANGISGTVATSTTTPAITLSLGAITPSSINGLTLTALTTGFTVAGGTTSKTLTIPLDATVSGTNTGDQTITLTGDVTGTGTGSFATTIANGVVTEAMQLLADNTTQNVSTSKHGYAPKAPNDATKYLDGTGNYSVPAGTALLSANGTDTAPGSISVQTVTHGLGVIPKKITFSCFTNVSNAQGVWDAGGQNAGGTRQGGGNRSISNSSALLLLDNSIGVTAGTVQNVTSTTFDISWGGTSAGDFVWAVES